MKLLRGLYALSCGITVLPIIVLVAIISIIGMICIDIKFYIKYKENIGRESSIRTICGMWEAVTLGVRSTMLWVKYGRNYFEHIEEL